MSRVDYGVRPAWIVISIVLGAAGTAAAGHTPDEDGVVGNADHAFGVALLGQAGRIGGVGEGGIGMTLEAALGRGRWQYFVEASAARVGLENATEEMTFDGTLGRGALGARWIARQFQMDGEGGVELYLLGAAGLQRFWWDDGGKLTRPEVDVGWGTQVRLWKWRTEVAVRIDMRVVFTPSDPASPLVACRGACAAGTSGTGLISGIGASW